MKKAFKITLLAFIGVFLLLLITPFFFKEGIVQKIKQSTNNQVNAQVDFEDVNISLLRNFPNISLVLKNLKVTNKAPFEGLTLAEIDEVIVNLPISNLGSFFSGNLVVNSFTINGCNANLVTNEQGVANYDISKKEPDTNESENKSQEKEENSAGINLAVRAYNITDSNLQYCDYSGNIFIDLNQFNHQGKGDFSSSISKLITKTNTLLSFNFDGFEYFHEKPIDLAATIKMDLNKMRFNFLENEANLDGLPLVFDGFVQPNENDTEMDLSFSTPSSEFGNLFKVVPSDFQSYFEGVSTTGNFTINGNLKGIVDETHIPTINLSMKSEGGSLKYKDLKSSVDNIIIDASITNKTGFSDDTKVELKKLSFNIDKDQFDGNAKIELFENPKIAIGFDTKLKLQNLYNAFHLESLEGISGTLEGGLRSSFDMKAVETNRYDRTKSNGQINLSNFAYQSADMNEALNVEEATMRIENEFAYLDKLLASTGKTDLSISGRLENILGYFFNEEALKGNFTLDSNHFVVDDFLSEEETEEETLTKKKSEPNTQSNELELEQTKIPEYLNLTFKAKAQKATYGSINLSNFAGILLVKNQKATLKDISFELFKGNIKMNGEISTNSKTPTFNLSLDAKSFDIAQSFKQLDIFNTVAPISNFVEGTLNSKINITGSLDKEFSPVLNSIEGNAASQLLSSRVHLEDNASFNALASNFDFLDEKTIDLSNLKTYLSFNDGKVQVKPFEIKYKDIPVKISGSHGFDLSMDYDLDLQVPAAYFSKYLDGVVSLSNEEKKEISVPVKANLTGNFKKPKVKTDLTSAISSLTSQIVKKKTSGFLDKGKKELLKFFDKGQKKE